MTSLPVPMVSSGAVHDGMKAAHAYGIVDFPRVPKARVWGQPRLGDAGRSSWPDAAYRQSGARECAGPAAAARAGETRTQSA